MSRYRLPRLHDLLFMVLLGGGLLLGMRMLNTDSDLGRHLTLGSYMLTRHTIPTHDILSFTLSGQPRPPYEWLAQVVLALAYRLLALDGVVLLVSALLALAFATLYINSAHRSGASVLALLITLWAALASSLHWLARPHVFSFLFFALWLAMLERIHRGDRQPLWHLPVLMLVWANTHGGFIYGFLALAAYTSGWLLDRWRGLAAPGAGRRLLIVALSSLVASILTPDLWHNWDATLNNRSAYILGRTLETMPLDLRLPNTWPFLAMLGLTLMLLALRRRGLSAAHALLLGGLAAMAFAMARNVPFFVIAAAPLCSEWLAPVLPRVGPWWQLEQGMAKTEAGLRGWLWSGLALVLAVSAIGWHRAAAGQPLYAFSPRVFPVQAADWLAQHPPGGHMFDDFNWGGYLLYRLWPSQRVYVDSQSDFYGEAFIREYAAILAADDWQARLDARGVSWIIIPPGAPLAVAARSSPLWRIAYEDATAVIFERR